MDWIKLAKAVGIALGTLLFLFLCVVILVASKGLALLLLFFGVFVACIYHEFL